MQETENKMKIDTDIHSSILEQPSILFSEYDMPCVTLHYSVKYLFEDSNYNLIDYDAVELRNETFDSIKYWLERERDRDFKGDCLSDLVEIKDVSNCKAEHFKSMGGGPIPDTGGGIEFALLFIENEKGELIQMGNFLNMEIIHHLWEHGPKLISEIKSRFDPLNYRYLC